MQYIRGDRECGILLWFLSQYCNFGCFQSKTPLTNLFPWRNLVVNTEKARTITAYFEKGKRRNNNLGDNAVEPLRADPWFPSHNMLA